MIRISLIILTLALMATACADSSLYSDIHNPDVLKIDFRELQATPAAFANKKVVLGGVIVKTTNKDDGTLIEIYQTRLDYSNRPIDIDISQGRFLALYNGFLDGTIYRPGRKITVVGVVLGEKILQLDEIDYRYPFLQVINLKLFQEETSRPYYPYYYDYDYPWNPWYPWRPWYDPYWPRYRYWP